MFSCASLTKSEVPSPPSDTLHRLSDPPGLLPCVLRQSWRDRLSTASGLQSSVGSQPSLQEPLLLAGEKGAEAKDKAEEDSDAETDGHTPSAAVRGGGGRTGERRVLASNG
jgi:hypothetical protein